MIIDKPGIYDLKPEQYHADPVPGGSLSSSGARLLLTATPAEFRHRQFAGKTTRAMEFGSVAHRIFLGKGDEYEVLDFPNRQTNAYKAADKAAVEAGRVPILKKDFETVLAMVEALRKNRTVVELIEGAQIERTIVWKQGGIWRRAMLDLINSRGPVDYKTTTRLTNYAISKAIWDYRYDMQLAWYRAACAAVGLPCTQSRLIFQSKEAPYLIRVVELSESDLALADEQNEAIAKIYRDCSALDEWPGYAEGVSTISLPGYANRYDSEEIA